MNIDADVMEKASEIMREVEGESITATKRLEYKHRVLVIRAYAQAIQEERDRK